MPKKYQTALIVGRFQPFHKGHLHLFKEALQLADTVVVAIGSAYSDDHENNPLPYLVRKEMIERVIFEEGWQDQVVKIVPSPDFPTDEQWVQTLFHNAGEFEIAVGNNDWTNRVISEQGYEVTEVPFARRDEFQGVVIRDLIRSGEAWEERIPAYLIEFVRAQFLPESE